MRVLGFSKHVEDVERGDCPFCGTPVKESDFNDEASLREFHISGLCSSCQIDVFTEDLPKEEWYGEYRVPDGDHYYPDEL